MNTCVEACHLRRAFLSSSRAGRAASGGTVQMNFPAQRFGRQNLSQPISPPAKLWPRSNQSAGAKVSNQDGIQGSMDEEQEVASRWRRMNDIMSVPPITPSFKCPRTPHQCPVQSCKFLRNGRPRGGIHTALALPSA
jgi:hypothetical protein